MFIDIDDDNTKIGDGYHSVVNKLMDRNSYLNRPYKNGPNKRSSKLPKVALKKKIMLPPTEESQSLPEAVTDVNLNEEFNCWSGKQKDSVFAVQREFINNVTAESTFANYLEKWPFMKTKDAIIWHFCKLTNAATNLDEIVEIFYRKATKIIEYKKLQVHQGDEVFESFVGIASHFKENFKEFIHKVHVSTYTLKINASEFDTHLPPCKNWYTLFVHFITGFRCRRKRAPASALFIERYIIYK